MTCEHCSFVQLKWSKYLNHVHGIKIHEFDLLQESHKEDWVSYEAAKHKSSQLKFILARESFWTVKYNYLKAVWAVQL